MKTPCKNETYLGIIDIGSERIASRTGTLGDFAALHTPDNHSAGNGQVASVNYAAIRQVEEDSIASYYAQLGVPYEALSNKCE